MAKNVAGLLPLLMLALYCVLVRPDKRPSTRSLHSSALIAAALIAPWHIYQFVAHRQWFWADYVQSATARLRHSASGTRLVRKPGRILFQTSGHERSRAGVLLLTALPFLIAALRGRRQVLPAILFAWLAVASAALLVFRFQNLPYSIYLIPPACLIAAAYNPHFFRCSREVERSSRSVQSSRSRASVPGKIWGLSFGAAEPLPAVAALRSYYDSGRTNELILADSDDFFYASTLPLPHVRYYFRVQDDVLRKFIPHYVELGIMLTADEFERLPQLEPVYAARLREWGLNSTEPIGTAILGRSDDALARRSEGSSVSRIFT